ncbi:DUF2254 domain-containing protein [Microvirga sp. HBU67558]|uniref:DUF2254 domain-containing protein n=1 Tax=Microvirga TaxID=186650 RepID=UPI001B393319|nr:MULTISPECIES: DUF2254 domain-containing protein [unclassified Microvirga]MBQ0820949.1 DUF2254 domain-containing protein [Microvirga sp. HBU67558]
MRLWLIPMIYVAASSVCGIVLPRIWRHFLSSYTVDVSVASAQAVLAAVASGMMALTGLVFALAFVLVQFSAIAYSPRLVNWFARDPLLYHAMGAFSGTFIYALFTLATVDRGDSGAVPLFSMMLVGGMMLLSMFFFARLVDRLADLQIGNVLQLIGDRGREVIRDMFSESDAALEIEGNIAQCHFDAVKHGLTIQTLKYSGYPRAVTMLDTKSMVDHAERGDAVIEMVVAVGDTLLDGSTVLRVHGGNGKIVLKDLMRTVHLGTERTFTQDPKYPIRLLVDIAAKALSPAINDPTTAVQAIDQIEDLLRRLGRCDLQARRLRGAGGAVRAIIPMPSWNDYLALAFDEIRLFGANSIQIMRRLRAALTGLQEVTSEDRAVALGQYLSHLDWVIERAQLDPQDKLTASQEDQQGLGFARSRSNTFSEGAHGMIGQ